MQIAEKNKRKRTWGKKKDTAMSPLKAWNHPFPYQNLDHAFRQDPLDLHQAGYKKKKRVTGQSC